ncbi:MAG TPA: Crp/Fnr family transcriptional regulator [Limnochordales bacterium]
MAATGGAHRSIEILQRIPFFAQLEPAELAALAEAVVVARYRKNQVLFVEGEPSHSLYFICSGRVKVYRVSPDGREQILHLLGEGDPIAVVPFFDGGPYPANAEVLTDAEIAFVRFEDFERIARANPSILLRMLRLLAQRLRRAQEEIASLAMKSVAARLAACLLDLAERHGVPVADGVQVDLNLSRQELGNLIGASRETTTRLLQQFQREKAIRLNGSRVTILDADALRALGEQ